jgi:hypothetical protein
LALLSPSLSFPLLSPLCPSHSPSITVMFLYTWMNVYIHMYIHTHIGFRSRFCSLLFLIYNVYAIKFINLSENVGVFFSKFTKWCKNHHYLISQHFYHPRKKLCNSIYVTPSPDIH